MRSSALLFTLLLAFTACASKTKKSIHEEMTRMPTPASENEVVRKEKQLMSENDEISPEKKKRLESLIDFAQKENQKLDRDIMKTKTLLFKELMNSGSNYQKISVLENQLLKLNRNKTKNTIKAYREARNIVGKNPPPILDEDLMTVERSMLHDF